MILEETFTLSNGVAIPKLGLGTWFIKNEDAAQAVVDAVEMGYRHIDTAQAYGNEAGVGEGVRGCGIPRGDIFVTTKLGAEIKSYREAVMSIEDSLGRLGLDYIDLMIIHSPQPWTRFGDANRYFEGNREAWRALEESHRAGKLRAIGLSNQILAHIGNTPHALIDYCREQDILVEAYSPVGHGELLKNAKLAEFANKYGVSVPQLSIRYTLQLHLLPLPKTANPAHMKNNADVDFVISDEDMELLKNMERLKDYGEASKFPVYGGKLT